MKNYNATYKLTYGIDGKIKTIETIVRLRATNEVEANNLGFHQTMKECEDLNRPVYALIVQNVEEALPRYPMSWTEFKGWEILQYNGGQSDYIEWTDGNVYSINGEFFFEDNQQFGKLAGVRWGLRREFDLHRDADDARHIFLEFDKKFGRI